MDNMVQNKTENDKIIDIDLQIRLEIYELSNSTSGTVEASALVQ